ncbi:MAG: glycosyltransferase family 2 protein [Candidatus Hodarchaeales archaeon]
MVTANNQERGRDKVNPVDVSWVVIPCYNEGKNLQRILPAFRKTPGKFKLLVVDDGSTDNTVTVCRDNGTACLRLPRRTGKGNAARQGCDLAFKKGVKNTVLMDGDGEHAVEDAVTFARLVKGTRKPLIIHGYRQEKGKGIYSNGNTIISTVLRIIHGVKLKDPLCGLKAFNHAAYREIRWKTSGYYMETEIAIKAKQKRLVQIEVEIKASKQHKDKGTTMLTGMAIVLEMVRHWIRLVSSG